MQENSLYKGSGGLTLKKRKRPVSAARSKEPDRKNAVQLLKRNLVNGPSHSFASMMAAVITSAQLLSSKSHSHFGSSK